MKVYVNGTLEATTSTSIDPGDQSSPVVIGQWPNNTQYLDGSVTDVALHSAPLSAAEIGNLAWTGVDSQDSRLVAWWSSVVTMGSTLVDLSGNGHDGTINGATWVQECPELCDPYAEEYPYDGIDSNCDGLEALNDADGDGSADDTSLDYDYNGDGSADLGIECAGTWTSSVYYLFCDVRTYWDLGNQLCQDAGYDGLASAVDATENSALVALIESTDQDVYPSLAYDFAGSTFLGYTRYSAYQDPSATPDSDGFSWVDGSSPGDVNWMAGEPNGAATNEDCLEFAYQSSPQGMWNDVFCFEGQHATWPASERKISCSLRP
jgi:hypothetical protein